VNTVAIQVDVTRLAEERGLTVTKGRTCGTCTACCKAYDVPNDVGGFISREGEWCTFCKIGKGCTIYTTRPKTCVDYECLWLMGLFADVDRPDHSKVIAALGTGYTEDGSPADMWQLNETTHGAGDNTRCMRLVSVLHQVANLPTGLARNDGTKDVLEDGEWIRVHERQPAPPGIIILP